MVIAKGVNKVRHPEAGVTLVELMITIGIMVLAIVLLMGSILPSVVTRSVIEERTRATATISTVMEDVRTLSLEQLVVYVPAAAGGLGAPQQVQVTAFDQGGNAVLLPVDPTQPIPIFPNPLEIQVAVMWRDAQGRSYTERASTLLRR